MRIEINDDIIYDELLPRAIKELHDDIVKGMKHNKKNYPKNYRLDKKDNKKLLKSLETVYYYLAAESL